MSGVQVSKRSTAGNRSAASRGVKDVDPRPYAVVGLVLLLASPLVSLPGGAETHPLTKATVAAVGCALILAAPRLRVVPRSVALSIVVVFAALGAATLINSSISPSLFGSYPRYEGIWVFSVYVAALVAGARMAAYRITNRAVTWTLSSAAIVVAIVALIAAVAGTQPRISSLLGNASDLGIWAAMCAILLVPPALKRQPEAIAGCAAALVCVVLSASRGAIVALIVGPIVLVVLSIRKRNALVVLAGAGSVAIGAIVIPATRARLFGEGAGASRTVGIRNELWADSWDVFLNQPIFGFGPSRFVDIMSANHSDAFMRLVGGRYVLDSPHNVVLQVLLAGGLVLLAAILLLLWNWGRYAYRALTADRDQVAAPIAGVVVFAVGLMFHYTAPGTVPLAAFLAGSVVSLKLTSDESVATGDRFVQIRHQKEPAHADQAVRILGSTWLGLCALVLAVGTFAEVKVTEALDAGGRGDIPGFTSGWDAAEATRFWDSDLVLRRARASNWVVSNGLANPTICLEPTTLAMTSHPTSSEAVADRAKCQAYNSDINGSLQTLSAGLVANPNDVELLVLQGRALAAAGDQAAAIASFKRALNIQPGNREARTGLATAQQ